MNILIKPADLENAGWEIEPPLPPFFSICRILKKLPDGHLANYMAYDEDEFLSVPVGNPDTEAYQFAVSRFEGIPYTVVERE